MVVPLKYVEDLKGELDYYQVPISWYQYPDYVNAIQGKKVLSATSTSFVFADEEIAFLDGGTCAFDMKVAYKKTGHISLSPFFHRINYVSKDIEDWNYVGRMHFNGFKSFDELRRIKPMAITLEPPLYRGIVINPMERQRRIKNLKHADMNDTWHQDALPIIKAFIQEVRHLYEG